MTQITRIHQDKRPRRIHFIPEWARLRGMKQADIVREFPSDSGVNKSTVSRWFKGSLPSEANLEVLSGILHTDDPSALFRDPAEDWIAKLLRGKSQDERKRITQIIELSLQRTGTDG